MWWVTQKGFFGDIGPWVELFLELVSDSGLKGSAGDLKGMSLRCSVCVLPKHLGTLQELSLLQEGKWQQMPSPVFIGTKTRKRQNLTKGRPLRMSVNLPRAGII